jgi:hypothetical protein
MIFCILILLGDDKLGAEFGRDVEDRKESLYLLNVNNIYKS